SAHRVSSATAKIRRSTRADLVSVCSRLRQTGAALARHLATQSRFRLRPDRFKRAQHVEQLSGSKCVGSRSRNHGVCAHAVADSLRQTDLALVAHKAGSRDGRRARVFECAVLRTFGLVDGAAWCLARQTSNAARVCKHVAVKRSDGDHAGLQPRAIWWAEALGDGAKRSRARLVCTGRKSRTELGPGQYHLAVAGGCVSAGAPTRYREVVLTRPKLDLE